MKITDLFSKRQKRLRGEMPDVFSYDKIPSALRVQVIHILKDAVGDNKSAYEFIYNTLCREYGVLKLKPDDHLKSYATSLFDYLLSCEDVEKVLDVVELSFRVVDVVIREDYRLRSAAKLSSDDAISELNFRFREHGIGYQYESGQIIRVDQQLLHSDVVKPVLKILRDDKHYAGANKEFLKAYEHYRRGNKEECINECLKAFESTMKAICAKRNWPHSQDDSARKLIKICFEHGLVPAFLQSEFAGLRSVLESGVPTIRNKMSGHGQGVQNRQIPNHFVSFVLHLTATSILFLTQSERELP